MARALVIFIAIASGCSRRDAAPREPEPTPPTPVAPPAPPAPPRPVVAASLQEPQAKPIAKADCDAAMTAKDKRVASNEVISTVDVIGLSDDLAVCRIEHTYKRKETVEVRFGESVDATFADTTIELAPVTRTPRLTMGGRIQVATATKLLGFAFPPDHPGLGSVPFRGTDVAVSLFAFTKTESALLVEVMSEFADPGMQSDKTVSTLYRVAPARLTEVLSFESSYTRDDNKDESSSRCHLVPPALRSTLPRTLSVTCEQTEAPHDGTSSSTSSVERYSWNGTRYER
jgi:hypothetical protein